MKEPEGAGVSPVYLQDEPTGRPDLAPQRSDALSAKALERDWGKMPEETTNPDAGDLRPASAQENGLDAVTPEQLSTLKQDVLSPSIGKPVGPSVGKNEEASPDGLFVVGIGASAGGLEAINAFFDALPPTEHAAYVVIQHLSPNFESMMDQLLSSHTAMNICRASDGMTIEAGFIYLMTPGKNLIIRGGRLYEKEPDRSRTINLPIDLFFNSLAEDQGGRAVAVILSGTGSDGTRGLQAIKDRGGFVMAQDRATAGFDGMPLNAIQTGLVDWIASPKSLAGEFLRIIKHPAAPIRLPQPILTEQPSKLEEILHLLCASGEHDFRLYKPTTLSRRIERRMVASQCHSLDDYIDMLTQSAAERSSLCTDLLIGVTRFFRDEDVWEMVAKEVIDKIVLETPNDYEIRIWTPGCSTGEEAYTLSILFAESFERLDKAHKLKIFATDVDEKALSIASTGRFNEHIAAEIRSDRLERYFEKKDGIYEIDNRLRKKVIFARHNLLVDPPFTRIDLATCRNVLIYLAPPAQQHALYSLNFSLRHSGKLLLGPSDSLGELSDAFNAVDESRRLYSKSSLIKPRPLRVPAMAGSARNAEFNVVSPVRQVGGDATHSGVLSALEHIANNFARPCAYLSSEFQLLYSFGDISDYLKVPVGGFTQDFLKLVHSDLSPVISASLRKVAATGVSWACSTTTRSGDQPDERVEIEVSPLKRNNEAKPQFLVFFNRANRPADEESVPPRNIDESVREQLAELDHELNITRENLQATIEELETSNEELQSSNEELLASNEEIQSTNEELHSVNEELQTVNSEFQAKISELMALTNDFENLLKSTEIGTVFLDPELRIRRYTPAVHNFFPIVDHDIGRPITHFQSPFEGVDLEAEARKVAAGGQTISREATDNRGRTYLLRFLPFITTSKTVEGTVITFIDTTELSEAGIALKRREQQFNALLDANPMPIVAIEASGKIRLANPLLCGLFGYAPQELLDRPLSCLFQDSDLFGPSDSASHIASKLKALAKSRRVELTGVLRNGDTIPVALRYGEMTISDEVLFPIGIEDLSNDQNIEAQLSAAQSELERTRQELDQFGSIVAHDLKEPLRSIAGFSQILREDLEDDLDDQSKDYISRINAGVGRMQALIDDLSRFASVENDQSTFRRVDTGAIVKDSIARLHSLLEPSGAAVFFDNLPKVRADARQLELVFQNLIENAIKYRGDSPPNIRISADDDGACWTFRVRDNGIGIKQEHQERIFDIFARVTTVGKGTGVGLAIVKKIVNHHGGEIWVDSEYGRGSEFVFTVPKSAENKLER